MKVIFLDVDGVLNYNGIGRNASYMQNYGFAPELVSNLKILIDSCNPKIVISSSWRMCDEINADIIGGSPWTKVLEEKLRSPGIIIGKIGYRYEYTSHWKGTLPPDTSGKYRGWDIKEYLDSHPEITDFVILDDYVSESDIPDLYPRNYVRCACGFRKYELTRALEILNKEVK